MMYGATGAPGLFSQIWVGYSLCGQTAFGAALRELQRRTFNSAGGIDELGFRAPAVLDDGAAAAPRDRFEVGEQTRDRGPVVPFVVEEDIALMLTLA